MENTAIGRLLALADYWDEHRQIGHTSAMICGTRNVPDVVIVIAKESERKAIENVGLVGSAPIRQRCITVASIGTGALAGRSSPLVVDHHAMGKMIKGAVKEMRDAVATGKVHATR